MTKYLQLLFALIIILSATLKGQNLLSGPECVSYDSLHNRYLVSNYNNGNIVAIDPAGNQSYFKQRSGHALGNCIAGNTFYVSTGNAVLGLDLDNSNDTVMYLPITGTTLLDGMTADDNNNLYVLASYQAKICKINLLTHTYSVFVPAGISSRPQDIIYDRNNHRLLICSWYDNSPIQSVSLLDSSIVNIVSTPSGNCDGLAMDEHGNYYFSTWADNSVYYYDTTFSNPPVLFSNGHNGPSNICYNEKNGIIAVPNFNSNSVDFIPVSPSSNESSQPQPLKYELYQNYPNPFNPVTRISWESGTNSRQSVKVYNILGKEVVTLINDYLPTGKHKIVFNAERLPSGVYFYQLKIYNTGNVKEDFVQTRKMILLK